MKLRLIDDLSPEDVAMLQALYSRSGESVDVHLEKVKQSGSTKFMEKYYVGYSHKSIADCGSTTLFIEDVSMLAAKAIQNNPLYNGQESSSRYIDMGTRAIIDPVGTAASKAILDRWMDFYRDNQTSVAATVRARYPKKSDEKQTAYDGAVKARTFDILRAFLPAGITTQLSWHTNLRQAGDQLNWLTGHPMEEVKEIANQLGVLLHEHYPSSVQGLAAVGSSNSIQAERQAWEANAMRATARLAANDFNAPNYSVTSMVRESPKMPGIRTAIGGMLATRPRGCVLPHSLTDLGQFQFRFMLDYGSFRDLQRHRNGVVRMPMLWVGRPFEPWYLDQLDADVRTAAETLITQQRQAIIELGTDLLTQEYYTALGFQVPCQVTMGLPALVYFLELRSGKMVHPTLRRVVHELIRIVENECPDVALHVDRDPDDWDVRRGTQTITEKA